MVDVTELGLPATSTRFKTFWSSRTFFNKIAKTDVTASEGQ